MYVLIMLGWLIDEVGPEGFDTNYMKVIRINHEAHTVVVANGNRPDLTVPFNHIWNLELAK